MIQRNSPVDPTVHWICTEMAKKCLHIVSGLLRDEERHDALEAFYIAAREVIEKPYTDTREV
jgi:hypothetical protein